MEKYPILNIEKVPVENIDSKILQKLVERAQGHFAALKRESDTFDDNSLVVRQGTHDNDPHDSDPHDKDVHDRDNFDRANFDRA